MQRFLESEDEIGVSAHLQDIPEGACTKCTPYNRSFFMHGQKNNLSETRSAKLLNGLNTTPVRHGDINDSEIGFKRLHGPH